MKAHRRVTIAATVLSSLMALTACGGSSPDELLKDARSRMAKNEHQSAMLQVKTALQKQPDISEGRYLLGALLLDTGEAQLAVIELRRAIELGHPIDEAVPVLAKALLATGQYQVLINDFAKQNLSTPTANAQLKTSLAYAYEYLDKSDLAQEAIAAAQKAVPDYPATLILIARIAGYKKQPDAAMATMDKVLKATPNDAQAWFQKGELLVLSKGELAGATEAFRKTLELQPRFHEARYALISLLIGARDLKGATVQVAELSKLQPKHPLTKYFEAQLGLLKGDTKLALESIEIAQKSMPSTVRVLQLAGEIQMASGSLLQAEKSFSQALNINPNAPVTRRQLARLHMRMGQPSKALEVLKPLLAGTDNNAQNFALAGEAQLMAGNTEQARNNFEKAVKLDPSNSKNLSQLTVFKQPSVGFEATVTELQKIAATDKDTSADLALISVLVQQKAYDRAVKAVAALEVKLPQNPLPKNLRGNVQLLQGDTAAARASYEQALKIDPLFIPAATSLANLDLLNKDIASAKSRFDSILKADPRNLDALLAQVKLRGLEAAPASEIASLLAKAVQLNPGEAEPRLMLINLQLETKDNKSALASAQDANAKIANQPDLVDALGRTQMAAGETQQAISTFNKLVALEPKSTRPLMRLAAAQLINGSTQQAEQSLNRALSLSPNFLPAQQALIKTSMADKRYDAAIQVARTVQQQRPNETTGQDLEAEIEMTRGNKAAAVDVYRRAVKKYPVAIMAVKLHAALRGAQQDAEADKFAATWINEHPKDAGFPAYLGDLALLQKQYDVAEKHFRTVATLRPDSADALNNIAVTLFKQNKAGATAFAEQALKLRPKDPGLMDTLATALAADKQLPQALAIQKQALALAPDDKTLRLHLAKLHIQAGDKKAASVELKELAKLGAKFPAQSEVDALLKSL